MKEKFCVSSPLAGEDANRLELVKINLNPDHLNTRGIMADYVKM
jgi:hypothetical protein